MQVSIVNLSEVNSDNELFRIDAEYFKADVLELEYKIKNKKWGYLGQISKSIINFGAYSLCNHIEFIDNGVPYLNVGNIGDGIIDYKQAPKIKAQLSQDVLWKSLVKENQVLLTIAGTIGNAAIANNLPKHCNSNQAIANIDLNNDVSPYYLTIFLNCKYGKSQTKRLTISSVQPNLLLTQVKKIKTYLASSEFRELIEKQYKLVLDMLSLSEASYQQAQDLFLSELGLTNWQPKHQLTFIKNYSDTEQAGRIDAEYYQPKYEEIIKAIQSYSGGWDTLGNLVAIKGKNYNPKDKQKYKYIELANISGNGEITDCMIEKGQELPTRARRKVTAGDVIVSSIEGSLSSIALIENEYNEALCSTGFHVINSKEFNSETLLVMLKSMAGQLQLKKGCSGTILTAMNKDELGKIVLPKITEEKQTQIQQKATESFNLRKQSRHLLECARRAVEIAIEQDEQTAITWLENEAKEIQT